MGDDVSDHRTDDDHDPTHRRDTLLVHVTFDLSLNELADVPPAKRLDDHRCREDHEHESQRRGEE